MIHASNVPYSNALTIPRESCAARNARIVLQKKNSILVIAIRIPLSTVVLIYPIESQRMIPASAAIP